MMSLTLPAMASARSSELCLRRKSSPIVSRSQQGVFSPLSSRKSLKPSLFATRMCSSSFLAGQSLRLAPQFSHGPNLNKTKSLRKIVAQAVDAGSSDAYPEKTPEVTAADGEVAKAAAQRIKIGTYFAVWWGLNVVFNIYNKKVLNVYPYPWLTSTLSLAAGSAIMLASWALKIVDPPEVDAEFWKGLAPVCGLSMHIIFFQIISVSN